MTKLTLQQVTLRRNQKLLCQDLSVEFNAGEVWAILGQNGIGKSTLLQYMAGLFQAAAGSIYLNATELSQLSHREIAQNIGILLQDNDEVFPSTVMETVLIGRHPHLSSWQWEDEHDYHIADKCLTAMDLFALKSRLNINLSGGERRRLEIATVLTQRPDIYLLDEPINHLDLKYQIKVLNHFRNLAIHDHKVVVMVLHDINLATRFCDYGILLIPNGHYQAGQLSSLMSTELLTAVYQHPLQMIPTEQGILWQAE